MQKVMIASVVIMTFFLFYIDEGFHDYRWMQDWGNYVVFVICVVILFAVQELIIFFSSSSLSSSLFEVLIVIPFKY